MVLGDDALEAELADCREEGSSAVERLRGRPSRAVEFEPLERAPTTRYGRTVRSSPSRRSRSKTPNVIGTKASRFRTRRHASGK
jgi:hypothetical protein